MQYIILFAHKVNHITINCLGPKIIVFFWHRIVESIIKNGKVCSNCFHIAPYNKGK